MFLTGTEPRCENPYSSLRSLRSPVQKFRSSRPPVARSVWAAGDQMPWPHSVCDVLNGNRTSTRKTPTLLSDLCDLLFKNSGLRGLLLLVQLGPPPTKY